MKILHLCLANYYIDNYNYQENALPRINKEDGNDVLIIASTEVFIDNINLGYLQPSSYFTEYGVPLIRIPYRKILTNKITHKLRYYKYLGLNIKKFNPDVIMIHDLAFASVKEVIKYKKENPTVKLFADTHTSWDNSGRNWISLNILHRIFYKYLTNLSVPYLEKYFYIGEKEKDFSIKNYKVPPSIMEFLPLGGTLLSDEEYFSIRKIRRNELGVSENERVYLHSGKLDKGKNTKELILAFSSVKDEKSCLVIIGTMPKDNQEELLSLINRDSRIKYLGWKSSSELQEYLCACDLYCQPGTVSATLQNAVCRNCAIMSYPHFCYSKDLDWNNFFWIKNEEDMKNVFMSINKNPKQLEKLRNNSNKCAKQLLDYKIIASKLYK